MNRNELAIKIYDTAHITGEFILRSGKTSNEYFDKYLFESDPVLLENITGAMQSLIPEGTEKLVGLEMGGIPIAAILSLKTGLHSIFMRKKAKDYGTRKIAEGPSFFGQRVCIVEDVVTTGGQIISSAEDLRKAGAIVEHVICVIVREDAAFDYLANAGLKLHALFTMKEIKEIKGV